MLLNIDVLLVSVLIENDLKDLGLFKQSVDYVTELVKHLFVVPLFV
jgi:hypothetical protein